MSSYHLVTIQFRSEVFFFKVNSSRILRIFRYFVRRLMVKRAIYTLFQYHQSKVHCINQPIWLTRPKFQPYIARHGSHNFLRLHFAAGFFGVQEYQKDYHQFIMVENDGQNDTLAPYFNCPNTGNNVFNFGSAQAAKWAQIYLAPTLKRLSPMLKRFNFTATDLISMQQLCAYEV